MLTKQKLAQNLETFTTGKPHFSHDSGLTLSAGVHFLARQTQGWIIDAIAKNQKSYEISYNADLKTYQLWELTVATDTRAVLRCLQR